MSDDSQRPIVIKKIKKHAHGHHGGAWKIAYADFVTAMMAFFLLMWLLGSTTKGDLQGIADYFRTPLKVALQGGSGSGDSSSIVKGGGKDLTRTFGQVQKAEVPEEKKTINLQAAKAEFERQEILKLKALQGRLERVIEGNPLLKQFRRQVLLDMVKEGMRIQIVDERNRSMFDSGSAHLKPHTIVILREIAKVLNEVPNRVSLSGHTDGAPYPGGDKGYSNWELSADRANASRRELVGGGLEDGKMLRVNGMAAAVPYDREDPFNPMNRRITIIVLNKKTEDAIMADNKNTLEVASQDELSKEAISAPQGKK